MQRHQVENDNVTDLHQCAEELHRPLNQSVTVFRHYQDSRED